MALEQTQHAEFTLDTGIDDSSDSEANAAGLDDVVNLEFKRDESLTRRPGLTRVDGSGTIPTGERGTLIGSATTQTPALLRAWDVVLGRDTITSQSSAGNRVQDAAHLHTSRAAYVSTGESVDQVCVAVPPTSSPLMAVAVRTVESQLPKVAFFRDGELVCQTIINTASTEIGLVATTQGFVLVYRAVTGGGVSAVIWDYSSLHSTVSRTAVVTSSSTVTGSLDIAVNSAASSAFISYVLTASDSNIHVARWDGLTTSINQDVSVAEASAISMVRICLDPQNQVHTLGYRSAGPDCRLRLRDAAALTSLDSKTITPTRSGTLPAGLVAYVDITSNQVLHLLMQLPEFTTNNNKGIEWGRQGIGVGSYSGAYANCGSETNLTALCKPFVLNPFSAGQKRVATILSRQHDAVVPTATQVPSSTHRASVLCTLPTTSTEVTHFSHPEPVALVQHEGAPIYAFLAGNVATSPDGVYYVATPAVVGVGLRDSRATTTVDSVFQFDCLVTRLEFGDAVDLTTKRRRSGAVPVAYGGGQAYVGGGLLRFIDGANIGEQAITFPPDIQVSQITGSGKTPAGTYTYVAIATWTDASGKLHRSAVSPQVAITVDGLLNHTVQVVVKMPVPNMLYGSDTPENFRLSIYRASGSTFYLRYTEAPTANTITLQEDDANSGWSTSAGFNPSGYLNDTGLTTAVNNTAWVEPAPSFLYTTGGVLESQPPPAPRALWTHANRLWLVSAEDPQEVWFSKEFAQGISAEFNAALTARIEGDGPIRAGASLDDKCLLFTDHNVYAIATGGGGPSAANVGAYPLPELVARGVGTASAYGVVSFPGGVLFLSASGFKLLTRDMQVQDIGKNLLDITEAAGAAYVSLHVPERQQVWFVLHGALDYVIVFDYRAGKTRWCRFVPALGGTASIYSLAYLPYDVTSKPTPSAVIDATTIPSMPGVYCSRPDTTYDQATAAGVSAVQTFVPASVTTQWMRPDGLLGDFRVRRIRWMARRAGTTGQVTVTVYRQQGFGASSTSASESHVWSSTNVALTGDPVQRRVTLKNQRTHGLKLKWDLAQGSAAATDASLVLVGLGLEFAVRGAAAKTGPNVAPTS